MSKGPLTKLEAAIQLAVACHKFQRDAANQPYILHPMRVMLAVDQWAGSTEDMKCAAILHDIVEDCAYPLMMIDRKFGYEVARLVDALTRRGEPNTPEEEPYPDFIDRIILAGKAAVTIKLADVADNFGRLNQVRAIDPAKADRLANKYADAMLKLQAALQED